MMSIELKNLSYRYENGQNFVLKQVNLSIERGHVLAIAGKNGSGKTTLAKLISGLLKPTSGMVYINGVNLQELSSREIAGKIGLVFQNPLHQLFCESVSKEIAFGLKNLGKPKKEIESRVYEILKNHNLLSYRDKHPLTLSEGQKKRLGLVSVLAMDPEFLIVDEPTLGQDLSYLLRLKAILRELTAGGKGVLIISHDIEFISDTAHRIAIMLNGKIVADERAEKILFDEALLKQCGLVAPAIPRLAKLLSMSPALSREEILAKLMEGKRTQNVTEAQI